MIRKITPMLVASLSAVVALGALSTMGASATNPGAGNHFVADSPSGKTKFLLTEATGTTHVTRLNAYGASIECHQKAHTVHHVTTSTFTSFKVTSAITGCTSGSTSFAVNMNGCYYEFTAKNAAASHGTVHLRCPEGQKVEWPIGGWLMKFGPQTPTKGGATYSTTTVGNVHALTVQLTLEGTHAECHGGCQLLGTTTTSSTLTGAMTLQAADTETSLPANLTAT